jgi:hypothetical protein
MVVGQPPGKSTGIEKLRGEVESGGVESGAVESGAVESKA